jgi:hypothetical protein
LPKSIAVAFKKNEMKTLISNVGPRAVSVGVTVMALVAGASRVNADAIPYPFAGTPNPVTYTFIATSTGEIDAYFAGSTASYDNELGMLVNGVSTGVIGLDNHTSALGQMLDLGAVTAGDVLTFVLQNNTLGMDAYSNPALNVGYDFNGSKGHNHVYATPYTGTGPVIDSIPVGTFVAFEDLQFPNSDFNYNDEDFVFTDVSTIRSGVPDSASTLGLFGMAIAGVGMLRRRLSR